MALRFIDSFDHYDDLNLKWSDGTTAIIDLSGTRARTGIGCCVCFPFGPELNLTPKANAVAGDAFNPATLFGGNDIFGFITGTGVFRVRQVRIHFNSDGSVSVYTGNDPFPTILGTSAPNLLTTNTYSYVEAKVSAFGVGATVEVRINGQSVLTVTGNTNPGGSGTYQTWYLQGPGGGLSAAHDDVYLCDLTDSGIPGSPNNDFLGAIRNYAQVPVADSTPLQWTPNSGLTHYTQVREIPPDDGTTYVASGNVGDIDQYVYGTTGITPPVQVFGVQVCLDAALDIAGSRSIAPDVGGVVGTPAALSTSYDLVRETYDGNPVSGAAWDLTDFATVRFGPKVTA